MNVFMAVMEAVVNRVDTDNSQMLSDGGAAKLDIHIQQNEYNGYQDKLKEALKYVSGATKDVSDSKGASWATAELQNAQTSMTVLQSNQDTDTRQANSAVEVEQGIVGERATEAGAATRLADAVTQCMQAVSSALQH